MSLRSTVEIHINKQVQSLPRLKAESYFILPSRCCAGFAARICCFFYSTTATLRGNVVHCQAVLCIHYIASNHVRCSHFVIRCGSVGDEKDCTENGFTGS